MKFILFALAFLSLTAQARESLVCRNETMYDRDLREIHRFTFSSHCQKALQQSRQYRGYFCDNELMLNDRGLRLRQFTFSSHCERALMQSLNDHRLFCDGSDLVGRYGLVRQFSFSSECSKAIQSVTFMGQLCDDSVMINVYQGEIYRFSFTSECTEALATARIYRGRFCEKGMLYDHYGRILSQHRSQGSCLSFLRGEG